VLFNAIVTPHNHPISVRVNEVIIEQEPLDSVHEFLMTMGQYSLLLMYPIWDEMSSVHPRASQGAGEYM